MKLVVPPLDISEDEGFSKEVDIFNRKPFGEALLNLIQNTDDRLVLALDAPWGEGKSTFIKMWQGLLNKEGVPHVYFDAFENDYQEDPFLAISSQIYSLIEQEGEGTLEEFKEKATSALKVVGRAGLRIGIKALTAGLLDETILENTGNVEDVSNEASDLIDSYREPLFFPVKLNDGRPQFEIYFAHSLMTNFVPEKGECSPFGAAIGPFEPYSGPNLNFQTDLSYAN